MNHPGTPKTPAVTTKATKAMVGGMPSQWWSYSFFTERGEYIGEGFATEGAARKAAAKRIQQLQHTRP